MERGCPSIQLTGRKLAPMRSECLRENTDSSERVLEACRETSWIYAYKIIRIHWREPVFFVMMVSRQKRFSILAPPTGERLLEHPLTRNSSGISPTVCPRDVTLVLTFGGDAFRLVQCPPCPSFGSPPRAAHCMVLFILRSASRISGSHLRSTPFLRSFEHLQIVLDAKRGVRIREDSCGLRAGVLRFAWPLSQQCRVAMWPSERFCAFGGTRSDLFAIRDGGLRKILPIFLLQWATANS